MEDARAMARSSKTKVTAENLRDWLIKEKVGIDNPLFVNAVDLTIRNAIRDAKEK